MPVPGDQLPVPSPELPASCQLSPVDGSATFQSEPSCDTCLLCQISHVFESGRRLTTSLWMSTRSQRNCRNPSRTDYRLRCEERRCQSRRTWLRDRDDPRIEISPGSYPTLSGPQASSTITSSLHSISATSIRTVQSWQKRRSQRSDGC